MVVLVSVQEDSQHVYHPDVDRKHAIGRCIDDFTRYWAVEFKFTDSEKDRTFLRVLVGGLVSHRHAYVKSLKRLEVSPSPLTTQTV